MEIKIQEHVNEPEKVLTDFLYLAIYTPDGESPPSRNILNKPEVAHYYKHWGKPGDYAVFAFDEKKIVGACWVRCFSVTEPGYGFIDPNIPELSIAVSPAYRHQGIGKKMIRKLISILTGKYPAISLSVSRDNPAYYLYESIGFKLIYQFESNCVMKKDL